MGSPSAGAQSGSQHSADSVTTVQTSAGTDISTKTVRQKLHGKLLCLHGISFHCQAAPVDVMCR